MFAFTFDLIAIRIKVKNVGRNVRFIWILYCYYDEFEMKIHDKYQYFLANSQESLKCYEISLENDS